MYERMLSKEATPSNDEIIKTIGNKSSKMLNEFEEFLKAGFDLKSELKFPFGNKYGWGYKYSHKTKHLCYVFFEKGAITITTQIGHSKLKTLEKYFNALSEKGKSRWENRYPCGNGGGWIHYRVLDKNDLNDVKVFIKIRTSK